MKPAVADPRTSKTAIRILVIDDEPGLRELLSYELKAKGFEVRAVSNGPAGIELIKKEKFQLAICDLLMPGMDGITALIKKIDASLEVIVATGYGTVETAMIAIKEGAFDFVLKPFNMDEMLVLVERALEKSELKALVALYETSQVFFSKRKLSDLLDVVLKLVQKVIPSDESSIMLMTSQGTLKVAASRGHQQDLDAEIRVGERIAGRAAELKKEFLLINGLKSHPEFAHMQANSKIQSAIVCPLLSQDEVVGVLNLSRTQDNNNFLPADLRNASIFAAQIALAVQNAMLHDQLHTRLGELKTAYQSLESAQVQLVQSEKMASVGRLVSGVAHEINNPLTAVLGYSQLILSGTVDGEIKEQVGIIYKEAERCRRIVQDLLVFAGRRKPQFHELDPAVILKECIAALMPEFEQKKITVAFKNSTHNTIMADRQQIDQVFHNILKNAVKALEQVEERKIEVSVESKNGQVEISIGDNGVGIPVAERTRVFDPFYTTREVGQGTGLGLSIAYGIIHEHGGTVAVEDKNGPGALFVIRLPVSSGTVNDPALLPASAPQTVKKAAAKILLVEDEEMIRSFVKTVLEGKGHAVEAVGDGKSALDQILTGAYDIIISDYNLPKMDGKAIFSKAVERYSDIAKRFIFISGAIPSGGDSGDDFIRKNSIQTLAKPFTGQDLLNAVEQKLVKTA